MANTIAPNPRSPLSVLVIAAWLGCSPSLSLANATTHEVHPGDVLGRIISQYYPNDSNRRAIIAEIVKRNPEAFSGQDPNRLKVGKTLNLPPAAEIPGLQPSAPKGSEAASAEQIKMLEAKIAEQAETISVLEEENAALQEMVKRYAEAKPAPTTPDPALQQQIKDAQQSLQKSEAAKQNLQLELDEVRAQNNALQNDIQQLRASMAVSQNKKASASSLPWILLGLLALLTLPLIWLLRRKQAPLVVPVPVVADKLAEPRETPHVSAPPTAVGAAHMASPLPTQPDDPEAGLKLDIARAYLDLRDSEAAADILQDVLSEGNERQRQEAREILSFIN
ncbi:MAG: FimV/HubP family polar landmark protein [Thiothrix sp.]